MAHVHNATYVDWLEEAVAATGAAATGAAAIITSIPRRIVLEYAASADLGERLRAMAWPDDEGWAVRLSRGADGVDIVRARLSG